MERVATILAVNDIYRIAGVGEKQIGGLHRLRTLRKTVEKEAGKVLLLHAGDFLSPSLESRVFKGEQMIDAMNNLDGDPKKFDARMFVDVRQSRVRRLRLQQARPRRSTRGSTNPNSPGSTSISTFRTAPA